MIPSPSPGTEDDWREEIRKSFSLLDQIIEKKEFEDLQTQKNTDSGDSWDLHHLKLLKETLNKALGLYSAY